MHTGVFGQIDLRIASIPEICITRSSNNELTHSSFEFRLRLRRLTHLLSILGFSSPLNEYDHAQSRYIRLITANLRYSILLPTAVSATHPNLHTTPTHLLKTLQWHGRVFDALLVGVSQGCRRLISSWYPPVLGQRWVSGRPAFKSRLD
jgi:hypothetical protein